ncbi:MAG: 16S rRNA (cytidine(1402)-2'-O)-methyltransferase [Bacteroidales bacterium]|nr:16S rRNA (cytidine(1402)-2'-O)-methyltransferase [Bacteroidales bacterium]
MNPKLYLVPTPIGNLEDITLRAINVLKEVDLILAEDTRKTRILLQHYDIKTNTESFHKFNEHQKLEQYIKRLKLGTKLAVVSDAGTPSISDPGFLIVRECIRNEIEVECLPGATAFIPALVNSGLPSDRFVYEGFLPQKKGRNKRLKELKAEERTIILYESPHRLVKTLKQLSEYFSPEHQISVSRELTKIYAENVRGTISEVISHYEQNTPKGEIVIVLKPAL